MGVGVVGIVLIILRSVAADKRPAAFEYIRRRGQYRACAPVVVAKNGLQCRTAGEHITHIRHVVGVERTEVKRREFFATLEHTAHIRHLAGVELTQVKRRKGLTAEEHAVHIRHIGRIERTEVKRREFFATLEHTAHIRYLVGIEFTQVKFSKRWAVEHMAHIRHFGGIEIF